jgi:tetratricopeptide (TPR) repeat protein
MGIALKKTGKLREAIDHYEKAARADQNHTDARNNLGIALRETNEPHLAVDWFKKTLEINPNHIGAHGNLLLSLFDIIDISQAIRCFKQAIKIYPTGKSLWHNVVKVAKLEQIQKTSIKYKSELVFNDLLDTTAPLEACLLNYKLQLGEPSAQTCYVDAIKQLSKVQSTTIGNTRPEQHQNTEAAPKLPEKIVALLHFGRSGTGLIHSLVDGHSQISTLPSIYFSEFFDITTWEHITAAGWNQIVDRFIAMYPVLFDANAQEPVATMGLRSLHGLGIQEGMANLGANKNEVLSLDKDRFHDTLNHAMACYGELDAFEFFRLVHHAYEKVLNTPKEKDMMFYHIHNPDPCAKLNFIKSAPHAKWLMMVREPIQSCESWINLSFKENDYEKVVDRIVGMLFDIDQVIFRNQTSIGMRLEDLKEHPKNTINALCNWMGIEEEESLYEMTAQGRKWWGDPSSPDFGKEEMTPFGKTSTQRKLGSVFSDHDQFIFRTLFYPFSVRFGYVDEDLVQFKTHLQEIRPMLDQTFDFEKSMIKRGNIPAKQFTHSGSYQYLRAGLIGRWNTLSECHTYPHMLKPLLVTRH